MSRRTERFREHLRAALSDIIMRSVHDPRVDLATVSDVAVSADLRRARVQISVIGDAEHNDAALAALHSAAGFIRGELARRNRGMRVIPELVFELDRGAEVSQQMSDLLESIHVNDKQDT